MGHLNKSAMKNYSRIIVKVGTNSLTGESNTLDENYLDSFVRQICLVAEDADLIVVSSGAIRVGLSILQLEHVRSLRESQAAAAVGQGVLMHHYQHLFQKHGRIAAQVLLTDDGLHIRSRYLNARNTIFTLIEKKVIPIINENDTVSTEEIKFGDNDSLAAQVAAMVGADLLIFLSDVKGFYIDPETRLIVPVIKKITPEIETAALGPVSTNSKGGMITKIAGAKIATQCGCHVYIADGQQENVILDIVAGKEIGTHFLPQRSRKDSRKTWIGFSGKVKGHLVIDDGAVKALRHKRSSLLPAGITAVKGHFNTGDVVRVENSFGDEIGRGLTNYSAEEVEKIKGMHSRFYEKTFGYRGDPEVIHRDNFLVYSP